MSPYRTVVVGTDGSDSSLRAVDKAGSIASATGSTLVVACAYFADDKQAPGPAADILKGEAYQIAGNTPTMDVLRIAKERAIAAGAVEVVERAVEGPPVEALLDLVDSLNADLLVVGNVGLNTITGRLLGSVPANVARKSTADVLIVHTV